jgi:hypothetical protein
MPLGSLSTLGLAGPDGMPLIAELPAPADPAGGVSCAYAVAGATRPPSRRMRTSAEWRDIEIFPRLTGSTIKWGVPFPNQVAQRNKIANLRVGPNLDIGGGRRIAGCSRGRPAASGRTFQLARRRAGHGGAIQAGLADIDALVEFRRVIIIVALRNASMLLIGVAGLLLPARGNAHGCCCRDNEARQPQG